MDDAIEQEGPTGIPPPLWGGGPGGAAGQGGDSVSLVRSAPGPHPRFQRPRPRPTLVFAMFPYLKFLGNGFADRRYACFDDVPVSRNFGTRNSGPPKRLYLRGFRVPTFWETDCRTTETLVFYAIPASQNFGARIFGHRKREYLRDFRVPKNWDMDF